MFHYLKKYRIKQQVSDPNHVFVIYVIYVLHDVLPFYFNPTLSMSGTWRIILAFEFFKSLKIIEYDYLEATIDMKTNL